MTTQALIATLTARHDIVTLAALRPRHLESLVVEAVGPLSEWDAADCRLDDCEAVEAALAAIFAMPEVKAARAAVHWEFVERRLTATERGAIAAAMAA